MNTTLLGILNGIAKDAVAANDPNAIALAEELNLRAQNGFSSTYDASTTYSTTYYITQTAYPSAGMAPSFDSVGPLALNLKQVGG